MNSYWTRIWENREWLFSGIGVLIISIIGRIIFKKNTQQKNISNKGNGQNYVAEIIHVHNSKGLSTTDVKELARTVFQENFPKLQEHARVEAEKNRELFISALDKKIHEELNAEEVNKFNKPDIQFALKDAVITASRKNNHENRTILSSLIVERVKNDGLEFKEIVYNEAINTISRLTKNHLNILAFAFVTKYARLSNVKDFNDFELLLRKSICPFSEFNSSKAQFQHLEYSDCANIAFGATRIESIFRKSYSNLFLKVKDPFIDKVDYENWNLIPEFKSVFFKPSDDGEKFYFIQKTAAEIEIQKNQIIQSGVTNFNDFSKVFLTKIKNEIEINTELKSRFDFIEKVFSQFNNTNIAHLTLTSVGIVIGASHLETLTGDKLNIDVWIN